MRYLSKVVFINSADKSLKYSEVDLDGNVHFIGTQGVGKSTLLRAILFFYNADIQKLGIPREKKNYNEYYFPYQNSYIIYEVKTETGAFCILTLKSQGRVAFRFINAAYDKKHFIDNDGKAFEAWDKIRERLGKIYSTRLINSYEEYRNILYGNNKDLQSEFRKYALIESKQYQNIPRTIANVFLNAKLDAEFVKETIIKSLNDDEVTIDLIKYSQTHLKDFETNLNDIKKWTEGNIDKQAEKVAKVYSELKVLEQQKKELAFQLGYRLNNIKINQSKMKEKMTAEELERGKVKEKFDKLSQDFEKKKGDIQQEIGVVINKLKDIRNKRAKYATLKIESILERVTKKSTLELEKENLLEEKQVLTAKFSNIQQQYQAQLKLLEQQLADFINNKKSEQNKVDSSFINFKDELNKQYELIYEGIRQQYKETLEMANATIKEIDTAINNNTIKLSTVRYKRFYETEIVTCNAEIGIVNSNITNATNQIQQAKDKTTNIQREWELDEKNIKKDTDRQIAQKEEEQKRLRIQIVDIVYKIENSKHSLYGWLNEHIPDWGKTIGKVIDEKNVLFQQGLNPQKISTVEPNFYGISLDVLPIKKNVKTVADLQQELKELENKIKVVQQDVINLTIKLNEDLEKLKKRFQPKINEQKELIRQNEYTISTSKANLDKLNVHLLEWKNKAETEQNSAIDMIETVMVQLNSNKTFAEQNVKEIEQDITKKIGAKKKEKQAKIDVEQQKWSVALQQLDEQIKTKRQNSGQQAAIINANQHQELAIKGANTQRINEINLRLAETDSELNFIENNRDTVAEYNQDKRELLDKEVEFKHRKFLLDKQIETESERCQQQQHKFSELIASLQAEINAINETLMIYNKDVDAFESFKKAEIYQTIEQFILSFTNEHQTAQNGVYLISQLHTTDNTITKRENELRDAINTFTGHFNVNNVFSFKVKFANRVEYFDFADMLKEFVDENKIVEYKQRVEERFANIIRLIGRETNSLIEKEGEISKVIAEINNDFVARNFVGAIKRMELKTIESKNKIFTLLVEIKHFNDENIFNLGEPNLFSTNEQANKNEKAIFLLMQLIKEMAVAKEKEITLSDSFELLFKIVENDNDTGWVEKLTNVGSEGTDILVKAMINIMLLNVFKEKAAKKQKDDFRLHCMMDEIGKLHPSNVKGILKFANDRNILLINSSPTSLNAMDYRYTYLLSKDDKNVTSIKRLVRKIAKLETQVNI